MPAVPHNDVIGDDADADLHHPRDDAARSLNAVVPWLRFVGPGRILGGIGAVLVLAGVAWWMLRVPGVPTESRLPMAQRAEAAGVGAGSQVGDPSSSPSTTASPTTTSRVAIVVHVTGAVQSPGVYELLPGQRVADAVAAAGGPLADADADALNLAAPVADGDRIAVPTNGDSVAPGGGATGHQHAGTVIDGQHAPVNINAAEAGELETLPGIGPATAAAIVEHRRVHGPYATIDDLEAVRGIGPAKVEAIREHVTT